MSSSTLSRGSQPASSAAERVQRVQSKGSRMPMISQRDWVTVPPAQRSLGHSGAKGRRAGSSVSASAETSVSVVTLRDARMREA
jgi:hypothetical protein